MDFIISWYILPAAFILDLILGDPLFLPHPVRWMGRAIETMEPRFRNLPVRETTAGLIFSLALIVGTWGLVFALVILARAIHPLFGFGIEILIIYYSISVRCLVKSAMDVHRSLAQKNLNEAKKKVAQIVGRDVEPLSAQGVAQATVETVAENLVDGVISPLFFAAIGGAPLAAAYKMVNTLDSMVGYKNEKYRQFGKASARIDDIANFIPARLSVLVVALASRILAGKKSLAFRTAMKEGAHHSSPNAGFPEAAFAGSLGVKLGGAHYYHGHLVPKPQIGIQFGKVSLNHIQKACDLMILAAVIWLLILWGATVLWRFFW
jgi:adenosylcobinamide-phosphate synthase